MVGWVSEWADGWMNGWVSEWEGGWMDEWLGAWVDGWVVACMDGSNNKLVAGSKLQANSGGPQGMRAMTCYVEAAHQRGSRVIVHEVFHELSRELSPSLLQDTGPPLWP